MLSAQVPTRRLMICADDYGIGPGTSHGILDLALEGRIDAAVLLVNSPYARQSVREWRSHQPDVPLGWHPCLTLDRPVLPPETVPTLVDSRGFFWPLSIFLRRWALGRLRGEEIAAELRAQLDLFRDWMGCNPPLVNSHQHVAVFKPVGRILASLLGDFRPYARRVREDSRTLRSIAPARWKRLFLSVMAQSGNRALDQAGCPGNDTLAGIANHTDLQDDVFFTRWIARAPGDLVELMVHPGYHDETLVGRDCEANDGGMERRIREYRLLSAKRLDEAIGEAGFQRVSPINQSVWSGLARAG
jgi:predicted glycoside hydrolase/deacetylase ChbG (UPF0249 family)